MAKDKKAAARAALKAAKKVATKKAPEEAVEVSTSDVSRTGRDRTKVDTKTVVEDRTFEPAEEPVVEYSVERIKQANGTIVENFGMPKGR